MAYEQLAEVWPVRSDNFVRFVGNLDPMRQTNIDVQTGSELQNQHAKCAGDIKYPKKNGMPTQCNPRLPSASTI